MALSTEVKSIRKLSLGAPPKEVGVSRYVRDLQPAHYLFKVESYSALMNTGVDKYETQSFRADGYEWKLILYPSGHDKSGYISLYVAIEESVEMLVGWEVNVNFKLFVFDQKNDNYLTIQAADGAVRKFHAMKKEWGFEKLIALADFMNSSNGYLVDDSCVFGVEVLVIDRFCPWESVSFVTDPPKGSFTWKLEKFLTLKETVYKSKSFTVDESKWILKIHPNGDGAEEGNALSVYLALTNWTSFPANRKVYAKFKLRLLDQLQNKYTEKTATHWFHSTTATWGYAKFVTLSDLHKKEKGYIKDNAIVVKVEILTMSIVKISR